MSTLSQTLNTERDGAVTDVAKMAPTTPEQAIAAYLKWRRQQIVDGFWNAPSFDSTRDRHRASALAVIAKHFDVIKDEDITTEKKKDKKPELTLARETNESDENYVLRLASLLTPEGWKKTYPAKVKELVDQAAEAILNNEDPEANQAIGFEALGFLSYLYRVETDAQMVRAQLQRRTQMKAAQPSWAAGPLRIQRANP